MNSSSGRAPSPPLISTASITARYWRSYHSKHYPIPGTPGPAVDEINLESVVTWTLQPTEKGTEVTLEHRGFAKKENLDFYNGLLHGWVAKLEKIGKLLKETTTSPYQRLTPSR